MSCSLIHLHDVSIYYCEFPRRMLMHHKSHLSMALLGVMVVTFLSQDSAAVSLKQSDSQPNSTLPSLNLSALPPFLFPALSGLLLCGGRMQSPPAHADQGHHCAHSELLPPAGCVVVATSKHPHIVTGNGLDIGRNPANTAECDLLG